MGRNRIGDLVPDRTAALGDELGVAARYTDMDRMLREAGLEGLPEAMVEAARWWERHIAEVVYGLPPDAPPVARPEPDRPIDLDERVGPEGRRGEEDLVRRKELVDAHGPLLDGITELCRGLESGGARDPRENSRTPRRRPHHAHRDREEVRLRPFPGDSVADEDRFHCPGLPGPLGREHVRQEHDGLDVATSPALVGKKDRATTLGWRRRIGLSRERENGRRRALRRKRVVARRGAAGHLGINERVALFQVVLGDEAARDLPAYVAALGDQPGVTAATVAALLAGRGDAPLAVGRYDDGRGASGRGARRGGRDARSRTEPLRRSRRRRGSRGLPARSSPPREAGIGRSGRRSRARILNGTG